MNLVVTSPSFSKNLILRRYIETTLGKAHSVKFNEKGERLNGQSLIKFIDGCDVAIIGLEKIDKKVLLACPKLKIISKYGVGTDNIDFEACKNLNVSVLIAPGTNKLSVAEHALCCLLYLAHNFGPSSRDLIAGDWVKNGGTLLFGKTVGIVGLGSIGKEVVKLLKPFNCNLIYTDPVKALDFELEHNIAQCTLEKLLDQSDFITFHSTLNKSSRKMIDFKEFSRMKNGVYLVNTARSELISSDALRETLKASGKIGGIALDVFDDEPNIDEELIKNKYVFATPHIAGNTVEAVFNMGKASVDNIAAVFN